MSSAAAAASARAAFLLSRFRDLSLKCYPSAPRHLPLDSSSGSPAEIRGVSKATPVLSLSDDLVSTAREQRRRRREYSALANVLCRVEPLDVSVIGEGISAAAKEAMKRTISSMLGLLPSDQFHVAIRVSNQPLDRLLVSSVITGTILGQEGSCQPNVEEGLYGDRFEEKLITPETLEVPSPAALSYIQKLEAELAASEKLLEKKCMEYNRKDDSDLLEYLRSLEPAMTYQGIQIKEKLAFSKNFPKVAVMNNMTHGMEPNSSLWCVSQYIIKVHYMNRQNP
ncbi:unnamed protein product [Spirodela intermedia]|uniref:Uncharacterized protein n=1 Tax=Spirodela intermedia TaxID=51605 RepID=A0A7I8IU68_SPIIN|nr:unnamed protein product [Spirodela intermedia]CAA6661427.1 unnamed protein product [Spirodela intermedia]